MESPEALIPYQSPAHVAPDLHITPGARTKGRIADGTSTAVVLPDLFVSIMSPSPRLNPLYSVIKPVSNTFTKDLLKLDAKSYEKHQIVNFPLLASMWMPEADEEGLRVMVDWLTWVFFFDDLFDEGELRDNPAAAQAEAEATLDLMSDSDQEVSAEQYPLRYLFYTTWVRLRNRSSKALQVRYKKCMEEYINGVLRQVDVSSLGADLDADLYIHFRRKSVGLRPCHAILEYACGIQLPDHVLSHPAVQESVTVSIDLVLLQNDILSYKKEQSDDVTHNLIHIFRRQGMTAQQAFDQAAEQMTRVIRRWHLAQLDLPIWGENIDKQLQRYLAGCLDSCLASLNWSFTTGRYFGKDGHKIRQTRRLVLDS